jgi:Rha family phage regulatory protein
MQATALALVPTLTVVNGKPTTTSNQVAQHFGKRHDTVLRAIRNLECSPEFHARNFAEMNTDIEIGNGAIRKSPAFTITRDGFVFLAMGFTGKEAAHWKEAYINAFNQMEAELNKRTAPTGSGRWLHIVYNGTETYQRLPNDVGMFRYEDMPELIKDPDQMIGADLLAAIGQACIQRLQQKFNGLKRPAFELARI